VVDASLDGDLPPAFSGYRHRERAYPSRTLCCTKGCGRVPPCKGIDAPPRHRKDER
jgi:hypothetical protein